MDRAVKITGVIFICLGISTLSAGITQWLGGYPLIGAGVASIIIGLSVTLAPK